MKLQTATKQLNTNEIVQTGWQSLVKALGPAYANKFLKVFSSGSGDCVKDFKKMWKGKSVDDIHQEIVKAKKTGEI